MLVPGHPVVWCLAIPFPSGQSNLSLQAQLRNPWPNPASFTSASLAAFWMYSSWLNQLDLTRSPSLGNRLSQADCHSLISIQLALLSESNHDPVNRCLLRQLNELAVTVHPHEVSTGLHPGWHVLLPLGLGPPTLLCSASAAEAGSVRATVHIP